MPILARAIGRSLSAESGLLGAFLPRDLSIDDAIQIAIGANEARDTDPPYAIVVSDDDVGVAIPEGTTIVSVNNAVQYRLDDRLVVVTGAPGLIHSITGAFKNVLGPSFPEGAAGRASREEIAATVLSLMLGEERTAQAPPELVAELIGHLTGAMNLAEGIHQSLGSGNAAWNCQWFRHVDDALENLRAVVGDLPPETPLGEVKQYVYSSFGLPRPSTGESALKATSSRFASAIKEHWDSESSIAQTTAALRSGADPKAAIGVIDASWVGLDAEVVRVGNPFHALASHGADRSQRALRLRDLPESLFLDPQSTLAGATVQLLDEDGALLAVNDFEGGPFYLPVANHDARARQVESIPVILKVPLADGAEAQSVDRQDVVLGPSVAEVEADLDFEVEDGWLVGSGCFRLGYASDVADYQPRSFSLSIALAGDGALADYAGITRTIQIFPTGLASRGCMMMSVGRGGRVTGGDYHDARRVAHDGEAGSADVPIEVSSTSAHEVFVWSREDDEAPLANGQPIERVYDGVRLWRYTYKAPLEVELRVGPVAFVISAAERDKPFQTPLHAALFDAALDRSRLAERTTSSARGVFESRMASCVADGEWEQGLGHHAVTDEHGDSNFAFAEQSSVYVADGAIEAWNDCRPLTVPPELTASQEAEVFRRAFSALCVDEALKVVDSDGGTAYVWPSQTSWAHLCDVDAGHRLSDYLDAYTALVTRARTLNSPAGLFWAAYPFTFSVWDLGNPHHATAVFLSPLHPLRLAWLARFESELRDTERDVAIAIAGTVEGWNLPLVGPRETDAGYMVAMPAEMGEKQVFAGWATLVKATNEFAQPVPPVRIAGRRAPNVTTSGLNGSAVSASIRDYRKINPQFTTLSIELASARRGTRSSEIDAAVAEASGELLMDGLFALPGGVRVFDSSMRLGPIPEAEELGLAGRPGRVPIVWKRFDPDPNDDRFRPNLKLLEDSGVNFLVGQSGRGADNWGILAAGGLRRFDLGGHLAAEGGVESRPALRYSPEASSFERALNAIEYSTEGPVITTRLNGAPLVRSRADWTVSGEGGVSPSALASELRLRNQQHGTQVLWEWRPPFLNASRDESLLQRRPYISIARLPERFRQQLEERLTQARGVPANDENVHEVFELLGARGIGLSTLLANGDHHVTGALGFFLAIKLLDERVPSGAERLILPIDACDDFLRALSGGSSESRMRQRADLLVMDLSADGVALTAIEVKYRGMNEVGAVPFPGVAAPDFQNALGQLAATHVRLVALEEYWRGLELRSNVSRGLWWNAFACLVDAGIRLQPERSLDRAEAFNAFSAIVAGGAQLRVERPAVIYLQQNGRCAESGHPYQVEDVDDPVDGLDGGYTAVMIDPAVLFQEFDHGAGPVLEVWRQGGAPEAGLPNGDRAGGEEDGQGGGPENAENQGTGDEAVPQPTATADAIADNGDAVADDGSHEPTGDGVKISVGRYLDALGEADAHYWPSNTELNQLNVGIVGDLGTGKTQFLKAMLFNLREASKLRQDQPVSVLVFDYKRDFQDEAFVDAVGARVVEAHRIPLNIFVLNQEYTRTLAFRRARAVTDIIARIYPNIGPVQKDRLIKIIQKLYDDKGGSPPTLTEVRDEYAATNSADSVSSVLDIFVEGEVFDDNPANLVSFGEFLGDGVVVLSLSSLETDQDTKNALVVLFLNAYYEYMVRLFKRPFAGTDPQLRNLSSFLVVDEAFNILQYDFPVLQSILLQGREFGVGVVLSSQYLDHFKTKVDYGQALATWVIHKVPKVSARQLRALGIALASDDDASRISRLDNHQAFYKSLEPTGRFIRGLPFYEVEGRD